MPTNFNIPELTPYQGLKMKVSNLDLRPVDSAVEYRNDLAFKTNAQLASLNDSLGKIKALVDPSEADYVDELGNKAIAEIQEQIQAGNPMGAYKTAILSPTEMLKDDGLLGREKAYAKRQQYIDVLGKRRDSGKISEARYNRWFGDAKNGYYYDPDVEGGWDSAWTPDDNVDFNTLALSLAKSVPEARTNRTTGGNTVNEDGTGRGGTHTRQTQVLSLKHLQDAIKGVVQADRHKFQQELLDAEFEQKQELANLDSLEEKLLNETDPTKRDILENKIAHSKEKIAKTREVLKPRDGSAGLISLEDFVLNKTTPLLTELGYDYTITSDIDNVDKNKNKGNQSNDGGAGDLTEEEVTSYAPPVEGESVGQLVVKGK